MKSRVEAYIHNEQCANYKNVRKTQAEDVEDRM